MIVGVCRLTLDFYNNDRIALKKKNLETLCKEVRRHYNLSILEIEEFEELEKCVIGFAIVFPTHWKKVQTERLLQKICKSIDDTSFARVTSEECNTLEV